MGGVIGMVPSYGSGDGDGFGYGFGYGFGGHSRGFGSGDGFGDLPQVGEVSGYAVHASLGVVAVGCKAHSVDWWRENWRDVAAKEDEDVDPDEVAALLRRLHDIQDQVDDDDAGDTTRLPDDHPEGRNHE